MPSEPVIKHWHPPTSPPAPTNRGARLARVGRLADRHQLTDVCLAGRHVRQPLIGPRVGPSVITPQAKQDRAKQDRAGRPLDQLFQRPDALTQPFQRLSVCLRLSASVFCPRMEDFSAPTDQPLPSTSSTSSTFQHAFDHHHPVCPQHPRQLFSAPTASAAHHKSPTMNPE